MDKLVILFLVLVTMAILVVVARKEKSTKNDNTLKYQYSKVVIWILSICTFIIPFFIVIDYSRGFLQEYKDIIGWFFIFAFALFLCIYFSRTKIYITNDEILKKTPFWQTTITFNEITKLVIYRSKLNPGAAMTRVYGKKKITLEAFLVGYEELVDELRSRCKNAEIVEK